MLLDQECIRLTFSYPSDNIAAELFKKLIAPIYDVNLPEGPTAGTLI